MAQKRGPIRIKAPPAPPKLAYSFPHGFAGGMNTSVNADAIAPNETPNVRDMELRHGVWSKRYGYIRVNTESYGDSPIRGMYEFWQEDEDGEAFSTFLVAWNGKLWSVNDNGEKADLCTGDKASIADEPVTFFSMGNKCYFLTGKEYCVYDGKNPVASVTGYIPTIVKGKSPDGTGGYPGEELNLLSNSWKEEFAGAVDDTAYVLSMAADSVVCYKDGELIESTDYNFPTDDDYTKITFGIAPGEGVISIQGTKAELNDPTLITNCTIAQEWGGRNDTRVFFTGNPTISNRRWHSGLLDPTYFPVLAWDDIGSDAEPITGLGRLVDYQIIYKERNMYYSSVEGPDSQGNISFPFLPMNEEYGCIAPRTVLPAQGGLLALSDKGITFTVPSFVRGQLNVRMISEKVNKSEWLMYGINDFTLEERKAAHAYIFDEKYYLQIKDKVWVLDLRHSSLQEGIYCWYPFAGVPGKASCFLERDNLLYVGDDTNGIIYKQLEGSYSDDGTGIDAWWTSPMLFMDSRGWLKKFTRVKLTFKAEQISDHTMTFITDMGSENIPIRQEAGLFRYINHSYKYWTYGARNKEYPSIQPEKAGYKGEYFQFKIQNNTNRGMTIMSAIVDYKMRKEVK